MQLDVSLALTGAAATGKGGRTFWNFEGGDTALDTFARTGVAYGLTTGGVFTAFASGLPRITDKGLLLEPAGINLLPRYAPTVAQLNTQANVGNAAEPASPPIAGLQWLQDTSAADAYGYQTFANSTVQYAMQCLVETPDEAAPVLSSSSSTGELTLVIGGARANTALSVKRLSGRVWLCSASFTVVSGNSNGFVRYSTQVRTRTLKFSGFQLELGAAPSSPIITTGSQASRSAEAATLKVPAGCTQWEAVYGDARTAVSGSGLTPGASFDLVTGRPWIGLGKELKNIRFKP